MADALTLTEFLDRWLESRRWELQPATLKKYRGNARLRLIPYLGDVRLDELTPAQITRTYGRILRGGGVDGQPLSPTTVRMAHELLHRALEDAVRDRLIATNPAGKAIVPRRSLDPQDVTRTTMQVWTPEEVRTFLRSTVDDPYRDIWITALGTGMRRGELLGLGWDDVDTDEQVIRVRRSLSVIDAQAHLKTTKSGRAHSLYFCDVVAGALQRRAEMQPRHREDERGWNLVFSHPDGRHLHPATITAAFRRAALAAPTPVIRLHDLRHTHATLLLGLGAPVRVVSDRLGHAKITSTLRTYAHALPAMDHDATIAYAEYVYGSNG